MTEPLSIGAVVTRSLHSVAPPGVRVLAAALAAVDVNTLRDDDVLVRATWRRQREFAAGRVLLRQLLDTDAAISIGPLGAPENVVGCPVSIAHDTEIVAVAAGAEGGPRVGIDIEPFARFTPDERSVILTESDDPVDPLVAFVIKEAVYKAWSRPSRSILEFSAVRLAVTGDGFEAFVSDPGDGGGAVLSGRWCSAAGRVLAVAVDRPSAPIPPMTASNA